KRRSSALLQPISRLALSRGTDALPVVASPSLQSTTSVVAIEAPTLANVESAWEALEAPTLADVGFVHQASKAQWFMPPAAPSALRAGMHVRRSWRIPLPLLAATLAVLIILGAIGSPGGFDPSGAPSAQARTSHTLPKPTATLGPSGSWLRIAPASLMLGCSSASRTKSVTLRNIGPTGVTWQAIVSRVQGSVPVLPIPQSGRLRPGGSATIYLRSVGLPVGHSGIVRFVPSNQRAGAPITLAYRTQGCQPVPQVQAIVMPLPPGLPPHPVRRHPPKPEKG